MAAHFEGKVVAEWLREAGADRTMRLMENFTFVDPLGKIWLAPAGSQIDGASIPQSLWTMAGSPFTGDYRRASVLHDVACQARAEPARAVHRMFYEAMICDGVDPHKALEFYAAVRLFGPNWMAATFEGRPPVTIDAVEAALDVLPGLC